MQQLSLGNVQIQNWQVFVKSKWSSSKKGKNVLKECLKSRKLNINRGGRVGGYPTMAKPNDEFFHKGLFTYYVSRERGGGWQMLTIADEGTPSRGEGG